MKRVIGICIASMGLTLGLPAPQAMAAEAGQSRIEDPAARYSQVPAPPSTTVVPNPQAPTRDAALPFRNRIATYKIKLSEGTAWTNLNPESWVVFEVSDGNIVAIKHSTNVVNIITGFSRWWDHPITESRACKISIEASGKRLTHCINGVTSGSGANQRHQLALPPDSSIHDYMFELKWQEKGKMNEALLEIPARVKPSTVQLMPEP